MKTQDVLTAIIEHMDERFNAVDDKFNRVDERFNRMDEKFDLQTKRMDTLIDTTNHRLDDFRSAMDGQNDVIEKELKSKANTSELLTSIGFQLANHKIFRWAIGIAGAALVGTAAWQHWWAAVVRLLGG